MPDLREHRGPHPEDARLFAPSQLPRLRAAAADYGWLRARGYAVDAAIALVGDHFQLHRRQRVALVRSVASDPAARRARRRPLAGAEVVVDGFNQLVTLEAALSGAVVLRGTDGLCRDLASVHGSYRTVEETDRALELLLAALAPAASSRWVLDRPVSNSGRLATRIRARGALVTLEDAADAALLASGAALASSDGPLLDRAASHVDLLGPALAALPDAHIIDLSVD